MPDASSIITAFVLENLPAQTVARRIEITRAAAAIVPDDADRRTLLQIASELERTERKQRKLMLRIKQRRRGGAS
ncbi:MAG: hypothetical protein KF715_08530 [Candidatus Didemnitutus sp.]|nr:hypothetical protein [Candidatus Didemnitutus sp.]